MSAKCQKRTWGLAAMKLLAGRWRRSTPEAVVHPSDGGGRGVACDENMRHSGKLDKGDPLPSGAQRFGETLRVRIDL
jgi:hypothetical protein